MTIDQYITVSDIRRVTKLSPSECYRLARRLPGTVKFGRAVRVPLKSFERYLNDLSRASSARIQGINEIMERVAAGLGFLNKADSGVRSRAQWSSE